MIVVLCDGVWDILHYGHILHLEAAKKMGDILWVSVTEDVHVRKGPGRPIYPQEQRRAVIKSIRYVDHAITTSGMMEALEFVKPSILVKGADYNRGLSDYHENYCRKHGIEIRYTTTPKLSVFDAMSEASKRDRQV